MWGLYAPYYSIIFAADLPAYTLYTLETLLSLYENSLFSYHFSLRKLSVFSLFFLFFWKLSEYVIFLSNVILGRYLPACISYHAESLLSVSEKSTNCLRKVSQKSLSNFRAISQHVHCNLLTLSCHYQVILKKFPSYSQVILTISNNFQTCDISGSIIGALSPIMYIVTCQNSHVTTR